MDEYIFDLNREMQIYNEAYFGKNKNLLEMQLCIEKLRVKYNDFSKRKMTDVYNDPIFKKFLKLIEDEFGFTSVAFIIDNSFPDLLTNAFTIPLNGNFGSLHPVEDAIVNKYGIKYKKEMNYSIMIVTSSYFLFGSALTPGECLAILLHDVGHSFTYVANGQLVPFNTLALCVDWLAAIQNISKDGGINLLHLLLFTTKPGIKLNHYLSKYRNNKILNMFLDLIDTITHLAKPIYNTILNLAEPIINLKSIPKLISSFDPVSFAMNTVVYYNDEKFADRFVAMYGYGEELASGLLKIQEITTVDRPGGSTHYISQIPFIGHLYALTVLMLRFAVFPFIDPHPQDIARALSMVKMLEHDLNDPSIPDSFKKQIRKDLENIKKVIKNKSEYKDTDSAGIGVVRLYNNLLMRIFPDGDFRNVLDNYIFKSNDRINNAFNKIKKGDV